MPATRPPFNESATSQTDIKERFYRYFQQEATELQDQMSQLQSFTSLERKDAIDHCLAGIGRLNSEVTDATDFLPAYDQRTYSQAIKALTEQLQETRSKFAPKARFQFKTTQKNDSAVSINEAAELAAAKRFQFRGLKANLPLSSDESSIATTPATLMTPPPGELDSIGDLPSFPKNYNEEMSKPSGPAIRKPSFSQATNVNISGHTGLHIILPSSASRATSSGSVTRLERCIVDMSIPTANRAPFAGIALKNIKHSLIIAGNVAGAAHITGVEDSIIVVTSRQVRMHDCKNVDVYLHVGSRPIIEDCSDVRFSPIPKCYIIPENEKVENQWDQVDDFKWLKAEHSPNWSILPPEQRLKEEIWTKTIPGGPGVGLDDILKEVRIL